MNILLPIVFFAVVISNLSEIENSLPITTQEVHEQK